MKIGRIMNNAVKAFTLLFLCFSTLSLFAQYDLPQNNVWTIGKGIGVDFNGAAPVPIISSLGATECSASVCDENGDLLFYTDGSSIWDNTHALMPNGFNINGTGDDNLTTTQGALIVPIPGNPNQYYVFTLFRFLYLNVVDMSLNNGKGNVLVNHPMNGIVYDDTLGEKMIAIRGCNQNVWVVIRHSKKPQFLSFEISAAGFDASPIVSTVGYLPASNYFQGEMKASPDGTKIATCNIGNVSALELFKFDNVSGKVYHPEVVDSGLSSYGVAFSPDGNKLYLSDMDDSGRFVQYNLSNNNTRTELGKSQAVTKVRLAPDGKVYFVADEGYLDFTADSYLGCVQQPDVAGTGCQYQDTVALLAFPNSVTTGLLLNLPNEVVTADFSGEGNNLVNRVILDTSLCISESLAPMTLNAWPDFTNYIWDDGTTGTNRTIYQEGTYWVRYDTDCGPRTDTFKVHAYLIAGLEIAYNSPELSANHPYVSYQWYKAGAIIPAATGATYSTTDTGWYSLSVVDSHGCSDSASYFLSDASGIKDRSTSADIKVFPNPATHTIYVKADIPVYLQLVNMEGKVIAETTKDQVSIASYASGVYFIRISDVKSGALLKVHKITK